MPRAIEAYSYGCLMAILPDPVASRVRVFASLIPDADIYDDGSGEYGRETQSHVTVKYGLHTGNGNYVASMMSGQGSAHATLLGMSAFENDKFTVLKLDVKSDGLHELNDYASNTFKCTDSFPVYHPHVTVAYLRKGCDWRKYACDIFYGTDVTFDELIFNSAGNGEDRSTVIPLTPQTKIARIASKVANKWFERNNISNRFPDHKTEIQVKVQIAYDGDDLSAEYMAQQAFLNGLPQLGVRKVIVVGGEVNNKGYGVN